MTVESLGSLVLLAILPSVASARLASWETIMKYYATLFHAAAAALFLIALAGCGAPGEIPVGSWAGRGVYMDYEGVLARNQPVPEERAQSNSYQTMLKIAKTRAFGRDALQFSIISKSGGLFNGPDRDVRIGGVLAPLRTLDNGGTLYAVFHSGKVKPAAEAKLPPGALAQATSMRTNRGVILQLHYGQPGTGDGPVADTFHFLSGRVIKTGSYATYRNAGEKEKLVRVWWVEELRPM